MSQTARGARGTPKTGTKTHVLSKLLRKAAKQGKPMTFAEMAGRLQAVFPQKSDRDTRLVIQRGLAFGILTGAVTVTEGDHPRYMLNPVLLENKNADTGGSTEEAGRSSEAGF